MKKGEAVNQMVGQRKGGAPHADFMILLIGVLWTIKTSRSRLPFHHHRFSAHLTTAKPPSRSALSLSVLVFDVLFI